jgi:hypothetical protein
MRTSNIILLSLLLLIFGTAAAMTLTMRYKIIHHLYDEKQAPAADKMTVTPLSSFSKIVIDADEDVTIRQGNINSIGWTKNEGVAVICQGDSLVIRDTAGSSTRLDNATITVQNLSAIRLKRSGGCTIEGLRSDSLAICAGQKGYKANITLDSSSLKRLHLDVSGSDAFILSNSMVDGLWLDLKDDAELSLENARMGWIKGRWNGGISLKVASATLQNGIQKIEPLK